MPRAALSRDETKSVGLYFELLGRYENLDADKMLPIIAVRLMFIKRGYDRAIRAVDTWGPDIVTRYARDELTEMARLWGFMVHADPPPVAKREEIFNCIKMTQQAADNPAVGKRIYEMLSRCHLREIWMRQKNNTVARKAH